MTRLPRIKFPGAFYHVTSRANRRELIFTKDKEKLDLQGWFAKAVKKYGVKIHAYCIMPNHYHLLVETPLANISKAIQYINGQYGDRFNSRNSLSGHVFQGRFHSTIIDRDAYFLEVARYIVLNPVRADLVENPSEWSWSSYNDTVSLLSGKDWLYTGGILNLFHSQKYQAVQDYRRFILDGIGKSSPFQIAQMGNIWGAKEFIKNVAEQFGVGKNFTFRMGRV